MIQSFIAIIIVFLLIIAYIAIKIMLCFYRYISTRFTDRLTNENPITKVKNCVVNTINPTILLHAVMR